jgi:ABC-type uncharacterized transport system auxiliary subunit
MKKTLLAAAVVLILAGCIARNAYKPVHYYAVDYSAPQNQAENVTPYGVTLAVMDTQASSRYGAKMLYRTPDGAIAFMEYERWVEKPAELVTNSLKRALSNSGAFKYVGGSTSLRWADYFMIAEIIDFDELRDGQNRTALFTVRLELHRVDEGRVVWSAALSARRAYSVASGAAFAEAMKLAVSDVLSDAVRKVLDAVGEDLKKKEEETRSPDRRMPQ